MAFEGRWVLNTGQRIIKMTVWGHRIVTFESRRLLNRGDRLQDLEQFPQLHFFLCECARVRVQGK